MTTIVHCAQYFLLAAITFLLLGTSTSALLVWSQRDRVLRQEPRQRHRTLVGLAVMPYLVMLFLLLTACLPSLVSLMVPALDHCPRHDDGHPHLCFVHLPAIGINAGLVLGVLVASVYATARATRAAASIVRAMRAYRTLANLGERRNDLDVTVLDTSAPVCLAAGLFKPKVLLSRGLLATLAPEERDVVLAHEAAHVRRRDALVTTVARACAALHLPWVGRWLVSELEIAAEQICDEEASRTVGDRVLVASAILSVERAIQQATSGPLSPIAVAFGQCAVERRIESLLDEPTPRSTNHLPAIALGLAALGITGCADQLHHVTESLLSVFMH